ncbi:hypothetical protein [Micromonospora chalcea]|uniref:hypothetical protein n=1 Tax=Micromonospora chalcea TaxID=1874 RepID=UPI003D73BC38
MRTRALHLIRGGATPADAAAALGISAQTIHARVRVDPTWQAKLDAALMEGRRPDVPHGTPAGYRYHRCHCPECRAAHHPKSAAAGSAND